MVATQATPTIQRRSGLRQIDIHNDLGAIADLIDEAFADDLDAAGRASLRELRAMARLGPLLYLMIPPGAEMGGYFRGFVWEAEGEVVGNITLQQLDSYGQRWMIANVAVRRAFRGRGIARGLMDAALDRIGQWGGEWATLQVRHDNQVARGLYERMGFAPVLAETHHRAAAVPDLPPPPLPADVALHPLSDRDQQAVHYLARQAMPELARWWNARRHNDLGHFTDAGVTRLWGRMSGQGFRQRLGLWRADELLGMVDADSRPRGEHRLDLLLLPTEVGCWERTLALHGLACLRDYPHRAVIATSVDYQPDAADVLASCGLRPTYTLLTMRRRVRRLSER
ncbi:MAG: GNAT family N-acetyltransferase [Caldilineales bacterium]|nr:GNAT family N-acetyltransferase [Caldilineales bacterium]MCW5859957.1 GNAT family N-acetyltransferase [Caldilineales bacterium]